MDLRTGEDITAHQAWNGVFFWEVPNPLYFKITRHVQRPFQCNHDIISIQIRFNHNLRRALGIHKCFLNFQIWTGLRPQTGRFLNVFRTQVMKYLDQIGVISINFIIRAVNHVLNNVLVNTIDVWENHDIKFDLY
ncbi:replication enhancer protein [Tomato leaf curl Kunene virus]|uniref:Replication enhancer n=1 Tax=Tomato leaf curl Kunene virus TaxID=2740451 RepID=A0A7D3QNI2_9GEMI|nr:replication enhancer protein [Tomato leaf curl Kunene virus]QKE61403.1 replication enhancer protein [Tomato leaf curl Kunene virus]